MEFPLTRDCFVTSITLVALNKLGQGLFDMDPVLVRDAVEDVFGLKNMPQRMFDKLNCGLMLLGTSSYTYSIEGFMMGTAVMNNQVVNGNTIAFCSLKEICINLFPFLCPSVTLRSRHKFIIEGLRLKYDLVRCSAF